MFVLFLKQHKTAGPLNKFPFTSKGISLIGTYFICLDIGLESTCDRLRERFQIFLINVIYNLEPRNRRNRKSRRLFSRTPSQIS
jgi:hypothetical protein